MSMSGKPRRNMLLSSGRSTVQGPCNSKRPAAITSSTASVMTLTTIDTAASPTKPKPASSAATPSPTFSSVVTVDMAAGTSACS
jgi:hypothetical protein